MLKKKVKRIVIYWIIEHFDEISSNSIAFNRILYNFVLQCLPVGNYIVFAGVVYLPLGNKIIPIQRKE